MSHSITTFNQIIGTFESQINIKNSKFIAIAQPVFSEKEAKSILKNTKQTYADAAHHCYAYALNSNPTIYKWSDDGEPSNSAGKPILRQLKTVDLTNTIVVVVRYFGVKRLGIPGLIEAYSTAAKQTLALCETESIEITTLFTICFDFNDEGIAWQLCKISQASILNSYFTNNKGFIDIAIPINQKETFIDLAKTFHTLTLI